MKIFSAVSLLLGLVCAYIQINDPDPYLWIVIYFQLVALSLLHFSNRKPVWYAALVTLAFTVGFVLFIPDLLRWIEDGMPSVVETMKAESPHIELVREGGGMLICLLIASVFLITWYKEKKVNF